MALLNELEPLPRLTKHEQVVHDAMPATTADLLARRQRAEAARSVPARDRTSAAVVARHSRTAGAHGKLGSRPAPGRLPPRPSAFMVVQMI
jgi:hypothetical protein